MSDSMPPCSSSPTARAKNDLLAKQAVATVQQLGEVLPDVVKARIYQDVVRNLAIKAGLNPKDPIGTD